MSVATESKQAQYAKNYPLVDRDTKAEGMGPITVGNIGEYNGRTIINLCLRTKRTEERGGGNATISFPSDWPKASAFRPGDMVNVIITDGYVKKIWHVRPEAAPSVATKRVSLDAVNTAVAEAIQAAAQPVPAAKPAQVEAEAADMPF
jgi:hypothetical protein